MLATGYAAGHTYCGPVGSKDGRGGEEGVCGGGAWGLGHQSELGDGLVCCEDG